MIFVGAKSDPSSFTLSTPTGTKKRDLMIASCWGGPLRPGSATPEACFPPGWTLLGYDPSTAGGSAAQGRHMTAVKINTGETSVSLSGTAYHNEGGWGLGVYRGVTPPTVYTGSMAEVDGAASGDHQSPPLARQGLAIATFHTSTAGTPPTFPAPAVVDGFVGGVGGLGSLDIDLYIYFVHQFVAANPQTMTFHLLSGDGTWWVELMNANPTGGLSMLV